MPEEPTLPIDRLLDPGAPRRLADPGLRLGASRRGRDVVGYRIGGGPRSVSLIAGCHADEPVGPAMLDRLAAHLLELPTGAPLVSRLTWYLVPHANPDGEARNASWTEPVFGKAAGGLDAESAVDVGLYLRHAVREAPGDDVEFGFPVGSGDPRGAEDSGARPENRALAAFLETGAPFALHASFHGMSFAAGPWFLLESAWIDRTAEMRRRLRRRVRDLGYRLHDVDRHGEKGFHRIDEGFTTRPDSRAMAAHFEALGDGATAALFRPSSMELARSLGGDPLTLVSEMPLFLVPAEHYAGKDVVRPAGLRQLTAELQAERIRSRAADLGIRAMPILDQMRLQLEYLQAGLDTALGEPHADAPAP